MGEVDVDPELPKAVGDLGRVTVIDEVKDWSGVTVVSMWRFIGLMKSVEKSSWVLICVTIPIWFSKLTWKGTTKSPETVL